MRIRSLKIPHFFSSGLLLGLVCFLSYPAEVQAAHTPTANELYQEGINTLSSYRGNPETIAESRKAFSSLIEKYPNSPYGYLGMSRCFLTEAYQSGEHYSIPKLKETVLPYASKAMRLGPLIPEVHEYSALLERILDRHTSQQETIQQYLQIFPNHASTYSMIGSFFYDREDYVLAAESYKKAALLPANEAIHRQILMRLGWIYLENLSQPRTAIEYYKEALASGERSSAVYQFLGLAHLREKDYLSAAEYFKLALERTNTPLLQSYVLQTEGYIHEKNGEIAQAITLMKDAAALNYEQGSVLYVLGSLFYKVSDYTNAYYYFTKVIRMEPLSPEAYYYAGRSAQLLGDTDQAMDYYRQYLELNADGEEARWIRENIPELSYK